MKILKFTCDRCNSTREMKADATGLPPKWEHVREKMLCFSCAQDLDAFLRGARIEHIAVEPHQEQTVGG